MNVEGKAPFAGSQAANDISRAAQESDFQKVAACYVGRRDRRPNVRTRDRSRDYERNP